MHGDAAGLAALRGRLGDTPALNARAAVWLDGPLDRARLRNAVEGLSAGRPDAWPAPWNEVDLSQASAEEADRRALGLASEEVSRAFGADEGPLWRASLIGVSDSRHLLVVAAHQLLTGGDRRADGLLAGVLDLYSGAPHAELRTPPTDEADDARRRAYWSALFAKGLPTLDLPTDRPRRATRSFDGASADARLSAELTQTLRELAERERVELVAVLQAAVHVLLHRYTAQSYIASGAFVPPPNAEGRIASVGPLLLLSHAADTSFRQLVRDEQRGLVEARANTPIPYPDPAESSVPVWCQVLFTFRAAEARRELPGGVLVTHADVALPYLLPELAVDVRDDGATLAASVEYDAHLFSPETARCMLGHLSNVLEAAARQPDRTVWELPLLSEDESDRIVVEWNRTAVELPPDLCSHHLFERQVERTPDAAAAVFGGSTLTYAELEDRANRLAHALRARGVGPDRLVAICLARSLEMAVAVLATLKAGGAYVPMDPAYPRDRLEFMIADSDACVLVTERAMLERLPPVSDAKVLCVDEQAPVAGPNPGPPEVDVRPEHLGYVIYTSGSTGRPKGVCLPHAALVNLIRWHDRTLLGGARTLQFASLSFDASFHEIFAAWSSGGTVFFIPESTQRDVAALARFVHERAIEKVILPVVVLQQLAEQFGGEPYLFRSLKEITTTGEQLRVTSPIVRFAKRLDWCAFHNH